MKALRISYLDVLVGLGLFVLAWGTFQPALAGDWIWDDRDLYIVNNPFLEPNDGLYRIWFTTEPIDYYPLTYTTFWIEWRLWRLHSTGYNWVNLLLHFANALVLRAVLLRLVMPRGMRVSNAFAWFVAAVFLVHPVTVESVAWISQRKTLLAGFFGLVSIHAFLRTPPGCFSRSYFFSWLAYTLAVLAKPSVIAHPACLLVLAWYQHGRLTRRDLLGFLPFAASALLLGAIGVWFQSVRVIGYDLVRSDSPIERTLAAGWNVWFYWWTSLWPVELCFVYPRLTFDESNPLHYIPGIALVAVIAGLPLLRPWGWREIWATLLFSLAALFPALGFVDIYYWKYSLVADHYQYSALPAMLLLLLSGLHHVTQTLLPLLIGGGAGKLGLIRTVLCLILLLVLMALSRDLASEYTDDETMWRATLRKNPDAWLAHTNLAGLQMVRDRGGAEQDEMEEHFRRALELRPELSDSHLNIGVLHFQRRRWTEAESAFREAARLDSRPYKALVYLGILRLQQLRDAEAHTLFREALRLDRRLTLRCVPKELLERFPQVADWLEEEP